MGNVFDWGKFKIFSLWNIVLIVFYMYDGCFISLEEVIE